MNERIDPSRLAAIPPASPSLTTPTGTQTIAELTRRRHVVTVLTAGGTLALWAAVLAVLSSGGISLLEALFFVCVMVVTPALVLVTVHALIGLRVLWREADPVAAVAPFPARPGVPLATRTAILMTLRNEDPARALSRFEVVARSVEATGQGAAFDYFILSDTNRPEVAAAEEAWVAAWRTRFARPDAIRYRRREANTGFKAGNIRDFAERFGADYTFMLPLDADSVMSGDAIVAMVSRAEPHEKLAILQPLVVGAPTTSGFARLVTFGSRLSLLPSIMGFAWYWGDGGTWWGHNALVRIGAFMEHADLPKVEAPGPLGGAVMSHDLFESWLMARAGYEVCMLPVIEGSYEEFPPTLVEHARREVRWCLGTTQYWWLLGTPGFSLLARMQLVWVAAFFSAFPFLLMGLLLLPLLAFDPAAQATPAGPALALGIGFTVLLLMPRLIGVVHALSDSRMAEAMGGRLRVLLGGLVECIAFITVYAVSAVRITVFYAGLLFGRTVTWDGQSRDPRSVALDEAVRLFWPQAALGLAIAVTLWVKAPLAFWVSLPWWGALVLAIPFAVITASPQVGAFLERNRLFAIPEDTARPPILAALARPEARS